MRYRITNPSVPLSLIGAVEAYTENEAYRVVIDYLFEIIQEGISQLNGMTAYKDVSLWTITIY